MPTAKPVLRVGEVTAWRARAWCCEGGDADGWAPRSESAAEEALSRDATLLVLGTGWRLGESVMRGSRSSTHHPLTRSTISAPRSRLTMSTVGEIWNDVGGAVGSESTDRAPVPREKEGMPPPPGAPGLEEK